MTKYKFLCADIGTTSLKVALVSETGQVLSFSRINFEHTEKFKISDEWSKALKKAVAEIKRGLNENSLDCDAICVSGNGPTIVSEDGTTLLWNEELDFKIQIPEEFSSSIFLPRIEAFAKLFPQKFESQKIFSGPEFLIWKLCKTQITVLPEARYESAYWNEKALLAINARPAFFGKFVNPGFNCGTLTKEACDKFSIKKEIPVIAGGPDFIAAMIGTNSLSKGKLYDCAGSSEGINLCVDVPVFKNGVRTLPSVIPGLWNAAVLMQSSGRKFVDCKKNFELEYGKEVSYENYIQYCFENKTSEGFKTINALAHSVKDGIQILKNLADEKGLPISDVITVTGGQAKNDRWLQFKADVADYKFCVTKVPDSELIGDAALALYGLGLCSSIQEAAEKIVIPEKTFFPGK